MVSKASRDLAMRLDPVQFSRAAGIVPDSWQAKVLRSNAARLLLLCARQVGKTSTVATLAAWTATYEPGSLILAVCPTERQSAELLLKVRKVLSAVGWPEPAVAEGVTHLELFNGSRILALPGSESGIRGLSAVRLLLVDEAARVSRDLLAATRPMLAVSGGRMICLSTPNGRYGNWFAEAWHGENENGDALGDADAETAWEPHTVRADQCPRIPAWFLRQERAALGARLYAQEYLCQFVTRENSLFDMQDLQEAIGEVPNPWKLKTLDAWRTWDQDHAS